MVASVTIKARQERDSRWTNEPFALYGVGTEIKTHDAAARRCGPSSGRALSLP